MRILGRCLAKDLNRRLRDIGDARIEIDDAVAGTGEDKASARYARWNPAIPLAALVFTVIGAGLLGWILRPPPKTPQNRLSGVWVSCPPSLSRMLKKPWRCRPTAIRSRISPAIPAAASTSATSIDTRARQLREPTALTAWHFQLTGDRFSFSPTGN